MNPDDVARVITHTDQLRQVAREWSTGMLLHLNDAIASVTASLRRAEDDPDFVFHISTEEMEMLMVLSTLGLVDLLKARKDDEDFNVTFMDGT